MQAQHHDATCADKVRGAWQSRREDLRVMLTPQDDDFQLRDDGTLDSVIYCPALGEDLWRGDGSEYRDESGAFDLAAFLDDYRDDLWDELRAYFDVYGLSFDYVEGEGDRSGYFRYQMSTGGPGEELRFYADAQRHVYRIEFWYLDWSDGACVDVTHEEVAQMLAEDFAECGLFSDVD